METEPVVITASIVAAVQAVLAALVLTNVLKLDENQLAGIVIAVEAVLGIPLAFFARSKVKPVSKPEF